MDFNALRNMLQRTWSKAPDRAKGSMPAYFHTNPRLDPVRVIAKRDASVEARLFDRRTLRSDGESAEPIADHELYALLDKPCPTFPELDGWTLRYLTFAYYRLVGEFLWLKVRPGPGRRPIALLPIPPAWVPKKPTVGDHSYLIYPYGVTASKALRVDPEDVVYFKDPDLSDPYGNGRGNSESIADEIETDEYAAKYQKNFFFNDANPPFVVFSPQGTPETARQIKESLRQKLAGWMHAREPAVLTGRDIKIEKLGTTMQELDMVESRKFLRDEALQHYQIPPEIFGILENSNRSTIDSAEYLFNKNVIADDLKIFERVVTNQLCGEYDINLCIRHDHKIPEDRELDLKIYQAGLTSGAITREQFCAKFDIDPHPTEGTYIMPFSLVEIPAGKSREVSLPELPAPAADASALDIEDEGKMFTKSVDDLRREKIWRAFDAKATSVEAPFRRQVKKIASVQVEKVKKALRSAVENGRDINSAISACFDDHENKATRDSLAPAWIEAMNAGEEHARTMLERKDAAITNPLFNKWVEKYGLKKAKQINDTTEEALRTSLSGSIVAGESLRNQIKALMAACESVYATMEKSRAELIARTESASTVNFGSWATYKIEGIESLEWIATRDDRTREAHADIDGTVVGIDEQFNVGGELMDFPGDQAASGDNVCNCRCTTAPVIKR